MMVPYLYLDIIITLQPDGTFTTGVYRKPTCTDLYLPWNSHHNLSAKYSVVNTLSHSDRTILLHFTTTKERTPTSGGSTYAM